LFASLAKALEHPEWAEDVRFATNVQRVAHRDLIDELIEPIFRSKTKLAWRETLQRHGVPADIVATVPEALEQATWAEHQHPDGQSTVKSLVGSYRLDGELPIAPRCPPALGEHREDVVADWLQGVQRR